MTIPKAPLESTADGHAPRRPGGVQQPPQRAPASADVVTGLLAPAVNQLFGVTLALTATAVVSVDAVADRLLEAVEQIDEAIWELRRGLLGETTHSVDPWRRGTSR